MYDWAISAFLLSPVLGTMADYSAAKKRMLGLFLGLGVAACGAMYFIGQGDLMLATVLFVLASVAAAASSRAGRRFCR